MQILQKVRAQGWHWFFRRVFREFINPSTSVGQFLKPAASVIYYLINKPIDSLYSLIKVDEKRSNRCLYFFYDFEVEPITYDFAWALCIANAKREALALPCLKIIFVPGMTQGLRKEANDYDSIVNFEARRWRIYSILLPIVKMLPCPYGVTFCVDREEAFLLRRQTVEHVYPDKYNVTVPIPYTPKHWMAYPKTFASLQADEQSLRYVGQWLKQQAKNKKVIVITLRQYAYVPARNSDINAWAQFALVLESKGYFVVFVPDTEQALDDLPLPLRAFNFFQPACWNLLLRGALYQLAYLNLGVNTGPMSLCWFNPRCRYITFKAITENGVQASLQVMKDKGFIRDQNPLFVHPFQKWVWDEDSFDLLMKEFNLMCRAIEEKQDLLVEVN